MRRRAALLRLGVAALAVACRQAPTEARPAGSPRAAELAVVARGDDDPAAPALAKTVAVTQAPHAAVERSRSAAPWVERSRSEAPRVERAAFTPVRPTDAPLPRDLHVSVRQRGGGPEIEVLRSGELIALRRGDGVAVGLARATLALGDGSSEPVIVEATSPRTLLTTRAVVRVGVVAGRPASWTGVLAEAPQQVADEAHDAHVCRAHEDGRGGYTVVCRVDAEANAANVTGGDEREGVVAVLAPSAGDWPRTLVRFDFERPEPRTESAAASKMIAYLAGGRGVVVRAELSLVEGERAPEFVLASAGRIEPEPPRMRHICRLPRIDVDAF